MRTIKHNDMETKAMQRPNIKIRIAVYYGMRCQGQFGNGGLGSNVF